MSSWISLHQCLCVLANFLQQPPRRAGHKLGPAAILKCCNQDLYSPSETLLWLMATTWSHRKQENDDRRVWWIVHEDSVQTLMEKPCLWRIKTDLSALFTLSPFQPLSPSVYFFVSTVITSLLQQRALSETSASSSPISHPIFFHHFLTVKMTRDSRFYSRHYFALIPTGAQSVMDF